MTSKKLPLAYEDRYCAFIDFLGFAEAVDSGRWSPDDIVSAMQKAARVSGGDEDVIKVTQFSDSVVLSALVSQPWAFQTIVSTAFYLLIELVNHDILLRGGITKGPLYHQDNLAFGPAFIRAYRLEQAANTPRIIVDKDIAENALWPESMDGSEIRGVLKYSVPKDFDGWRYVDYFSSHHVEEFDDGYDGLVEHYASLKAMVKNHKSSNSASIQSKYGWVEAKLQEVGQ